MQTKHAFVTLTLLSLAAACSGKSTENQQPAGAGTASTQPTAGTASNSGGSASSSGGSTPNGGRASSNGGAATVGPNVPLEQFTTVYAAAACGLFERCWKSLIVSLHEDCESYFSRLFEDQGLAGIDAAIKAGTVVYHPEALSACTAELAQTSCDATVIPDCDKVFVGTKHPGDACNLDEECGSGSQCVSSGSCPGTCTLRGGLNATCSSQLHCKQELECVEQPAADGKCVAPMTEGQPCSYTAPCGGLLDCVGLDSADPNGAGVCRNRDAAFSASENAACSSSGVRTFCKLGLSCVFQDSTSSAGTCQAAVSADAPCSRAYPDQCPRGQFCKLSSAAGATPASGQCTSLLAEGEACAPSEVGVSICQPGQFCHPTTEVCTSRKHLGEACSMNTECLSTECTDGKCSYPFDCEKPVQ